MGSFLRLFIAAPLAFIVTALIFLGLYNQLSPKPILYATTDEPGRIYLGDTVICDCGPFWTERFPDYIIPVQPPDTSNTWTESEKVAAEPPKQTPTTPSVKIYVRSVFDEDIQPCSRHDTVPLLRIAPNYPKACLDKGAQGKVTLQFDITPEGNVTNVVILESPDDCFNEEAISSVLKWMYPPLCRSDGAPSGKRGVIETISFQLADD